MPSMRGGIVTLVALVTLGASAPGALAPRSLAAQEDVAPTAGMRGSGGGFVEEVSSSSNRTVQPRPAGLCWRGRRAADCASFFVTEFTLAVAPKKPARRPPVNGTWELGAMHNLDRSYALGASAFVIHDDEDRFLLGLRPRGRYWISDDLSIDLGLGLILRDLKEESFVVESPSFTGRVGLDWADRLGVFLQLEALRVESQPQSNPLLVGTQTALYVGLRFGSQVGVLAGALAAGFVRWGDEYGN